MYTEQPIQTGTFHETFQVVSFEIDLGRSLPMCCMLQQRCA